MKFQELSKTTAQFPRVMLYICITVITELKIDNYYSDSIALFMMIGYSRHLYAIPLQFR